MRRESILAHHLSPSTVAAACAGRTVTGVKAIRAPNREPTVSDRMKLKWNWENVRVTVATYVREGPIELCRIELAHQGERAQNFYLILGLLATSRK